MVATGDEDSDSTGAKQGTASDGGVVARFPTRSEVTFKVAPTIQGAVNTLRKPLRPSACWRLDDLRFHFDSSFILPASATEFSLLASLRSPSASPGLLLSVFGHADPSGNDDYNKVLSGRRATAVYGLLVRDVALWEELHANPFHGDAWSSVHDQIMLKQLGKKSTSEFQKSAGLPASGSIDAATRKRLFLDYMDSICKDDSGPFRYQASDFLSRGASSDGKADRQGCSEFNPILVFSKAEAKAFEDPNKKALRDAENLSNRRVVVYMFAPTLPINPQQWPCPTVKEDATGCRAQFFPDADLRRNPQDQRRQYLRRGRSFACKFYDQLARSSPCEAVRQNVRIFLLGGDGKPSRNAPYRLTTGTQIREGVSGPNGEVVEAQLLAGLTCEIEWGSENETPDSPVFPNYAEIFLNTTQDDADSGLTQRQLFNLGYFDDDDSVNRQAFRDEYADSDSSDARIDEAHSTGRPKVRRIIG